MNAHNDFAAIAALDLNPIKVKLMHAESGEGWSRETADAVEFEYRRFLYLMKKFPHESAAPSMDVDIFWHYHILDTMKYAQDCEEVFGYFLHHFPYIGLRGEEDLEAHEQLGERMKELYAATFGETREAAASAWSSSPPQAQAGAAAQTAWSSSPPAVRGEGAQVTAWSSSPPALRPQDAGTTAWSSSPPATRTGGAQAVAWSSSPPMVRAGSGVAFSASPARKPADNGLYSVRPTL